ncbi:STAS domain-containing protein, partial [Streptomyces sp. NPDC001536]|uniref:STAS domain-containing protein n=1 Tax=Streptomyces sp. NPDC001536 TaxID=3364583 RepID=UPI003685F278
SSRLAALAPHRINDGAVSSVRGGARSLVRGQGLLGAWRQADAGGVVLVLACVPDPVRRLLELTEADQVLRVFDTVADAEAVFGG